MLNEDDILALIERIKTDRSVTVDLYGSILPHYVVTLPKKGFWRKSITVCIYKENGWHDGSKIYENDSRPFHAAKERHTQDSLTNIRGFL